MPIPDKQSSSAESQRGSSWLSWPTIRNKQENPHVHSATPILDLQEPIPRLQDEIITGRSLSHFLLFLNSFFLRALQTSQKRYRAGSLQHHHPHLDVIHTLNLKQY